MPVLNWNAGIELKYIKRSKLFRVWEYGLLPEESKSPEGGLGVPCHHVRIQSDLSLILIWQKLVWSESRFYLNWSESGFHLNQSESGSYLNWSESGSYLNRSESGFYSDHLEDGLIQAPVLSRFQMDLIRISFRGIRGSSSILGRRMDIKDSIIWTWSKEWKIV